MVNGSNMYAYCNGNPVMYVDPSGRAVDIGSILNGFLNLLLIGLTWLAKAFSDFFTSGAFLQAWEGFLKIGKSIDIFKENPDNPWPGIGMIFSGLGDWFAGFFNTVLSWFGWPSTKVEGSIVFSSDAEMAEPDSSSSSSPPGGGVSYAPSGSVLINTRYVRLFHNRFATDYYLGYPNLATLFRFQTILRAKVDLKKSSWNTIKWTYPDTNIKKLLETNSPNGRGGHGEITLYVTKEALSHVTAEVMKDGKSTGITDKIPVVGITQVEHQNKVLQTSKAVTLLPSQASVADKRTYG